jgi:hypothetical protein
MRFPRLLTPTIALGVLLLPADLSAQATAERAATVCVKVVDPRGEDISDPTVTQFRSQDDPSRNFSSRFSQGVAVKIPFGTYELKVHGVGFWPAVRTVEVYSPDVWAVVELLPGEEGGPTRYTLNGVLSNATEGQLWVRLLGMRSGMIFDGKVNSLGTFTLAGIPAATYLLIVRRGDEVLLTRVVKIAGNESLTLKLPAR